MCKQGTRKLTPLKFTWPTRRAYHSLGQFFVRIMEDHVHPILVGGFSPNSFEKYAPHGQIGSWISRENRVENSKKSLRNATTQESDFPPTHPDFPPTHPRITWSSTSHFEQIFDDWMTRVLMKRASIRLCCLTWNSQRRFWGDPTTFGGTSRACKSQDFLLTNRSFEPIFRRKKCLKLLCFFGFFFVVKIDIDLSPKDDNFIQLKGKIKFCIVFANCRAGNESKDQRYKKNKAPNCPFTIHLMASIEVQYESSLLFTKDPGIS